MQKSFHCSNSDLTNPASYFDVHRGGVATGQWGRFSFNIIEIKLLDSPKIGYILAIGFILPKQFYS